MTFDEIKPLVSRLRLSGLLTTLPARLEQAREKGMAYLELLALIFQDEIERREAGCLQKRLSRAKFSDNQTFENLVTSHYPSQLTQLIHELKTLQFVTQGKHVIIMGPTGTGKTHLAQAIGHQACRQGLSVLFCRANVFFQQLQAARADHTYASAMKRYCHPQLLILDDFGLAALTTLQAEDIYELIAARATKGAFIITSNRTVNAWIPLFPDPVMANAALDRVANIAYQLTIQGESYRKKLRTNLEVTLDLKAKSG